MLGSQTPSSRIMPEFHETHGAMASTLLERAGLTLLPWQRLVLSDWLALDDDGGWAASSCGLSVSRQNGKTCCTAGRMAHGMAAYGEWVVYTSHLQKTSTETFEELRALFESPALRGYVKDIKAALGREEIILKNGARAKFLARTRNGGRGQHGDLWVVDEAQELTDTQLGSFLPLLSASKRPQTIYLGTPPDETTPGEVFRRIRADALSGKTKSTAWMEWGTDSIGDVSDSARWAETNPSLGYRMLESTISSELEQMPPDTFARERLGWWSEQRASAVINADEWDECKTDSPPTDGLLAYAVKFSADGSQGVLAACAKADGKPPHVEVVCVREMRAGLSWFADWLEARADEAAAIVCDGMSNAQPLIDELLRRGVPKSVVARPKASEVSDACSMLLNAVRERRVTHYGQPALDQAANTATRRSIGSMGGWGFDGEGSPLMEAVALAHRAALTTRRDPRRKQRVGF